MVARVNVEQRPTQGLLVSVNGKVFNTLLFPVKSRSRLLGVAAYIKALDPVLARYAKRSGDGIALAGGDRSLIGAEAFPESIDFAGALPTLGDPHVITLEAEGRRYVYSSQPVKDVSPLAVAYLLTARDDTERLVAVERSSPIW